MRWLLSTAIPLLLASGLVWAIEPSAPALNRPIPIVIGLIADHPRKLIVNAQVCTFEETRAQLQYLSVKWGRTEPVVIVANPAMNLERAVEIAKLAAASHDYIYIALPGIDGEAATIMQMPTGDDARRTNKSLTPFLTTLTSGTQRKVPRSAPATPPADRAITEQIKQMESIEKGQLLDKLPNK